MIKINLQQQFKKRPQIKQIIEMKKTLITIDKYQFYLQDAKIQRQGNNQVEVFVANHTNLQKKVLLKKFKKNKDDVETYNRLLHEASILRKFNHEGIQVCHKLIKTKHNLYIVYGLTEGESMQKALAGHIDFKTKIRIVKQLSSILLQLAKYNIVHTTINPGNIIISNNYIKLINFQYAQQIPEGLTQTNLIYMPSANLNAAPEVVHGKAHIKSDIYSFGTIIITLFQRQFQKLKHLKLNQSILINEESPSEKWINLLYFLSAKMIKKPAVSRTSLRQIFLYLKFSHEQADKNILVSQNKNVIKSNKEADKVEKKRQLSPQQILTPWKSQNNIVHTKREEKQKQKQKGKFMMSEKPKSMNLVMKMQDVKDETQEKDPELLFILKKIFIMRNTSAILIYISQNLTNKQIQTIELIKLWALLIKSAETMILRTNKLMLLLTHEEDRFDVRDKLLKSGLYKSIRSIIYKQCKGITQRYMAILDELKEYPELYHDKVFTEQIQSSSINDAYFKNIAYESLSSMRLINHHSYLDHYEQSQLVAVYLLSIILFFNTYDEAFQSLFHSFTTTFQKEPFFQKMNAFSKSFIVKEITKHLKQYKKIPAKQNPRPNLHPHQQKLFTTF